MNPDTFCSHEIRILSSESINEIFGGRILGLGLIILQKFEVLVIVDRGVGGPQVVGQGAIAAPMFAMKGPSMIKGSYPPAFALKHQQKVRNCDQLCFFVKPETLTRRS
jgi:hypothetical protein